VKSILGSVVLRTADYESHGSTMNSLRSAARVNFVLVIFYSTDSCFRILRRIPTEYFHYKG